jgi:hypothetical protein
MKVLIIKATDPSEADELFMRPETDTDFQVLERLLGKFEVAGFGRDSQSGMIAHLSIELKRLDK